MSSYLRKIFNMDDDLQKDMEINKMNVYIPCIWPIIPLNIFHFGLWLFVPKGHSMNTFLKPPELFRCLSNFFPETTPA